MKIQLKWAWNPEDIGGRRMILVQVDRMEQDNWRCLMDAFKAMAERPDVERIKRTPNAYVHTIKFKVDPSIDLLKSCEAYIEHIYHAQCEAVELTPVDLEWQLSGPVQDRLAPKRPPNLQELLGTRAKQEIRDIRDKALGLAVERLDTAVADGEVDEAQAYQLLKSVITGDL